jgi:Zn-dependent peptidase ImmA (M78 family)
LKNLWLCVQEERQVESLARWRKLEAMLGKDPDEMEQSLRHELECEAQDLGFDAVGELASATQTMRPTQLVEQLRRIRNVSESGTSCSESSLSLPTDFFQNPMKQEQVTKPWMVGVRAAQAVRAQQGVGGDQCVSSRQIEDMLGCQEASLLSEGQVQNETGLEHSFILKNTNNSRKIVFRKTNYLASRRFDAARLLGDQLLFPSIQESLRPATVSYTHRQKTQRAFASELLCPFDALDEMFAGNYESDEIQEAVANRFQVSPLLIRTQLVNHQKLDREFI